MSMAVTVYGIKNTKTGRVYVGQTHRPIKCRFREHMLKLQKGEHPAYGMQEDYDKYGDCFEITVLEVVENPVRDTSERKWMKQLKTYDERFGYNSKETYVIPMRREAGLYVPPSPRKGRKFPKTERIKP